MNETEKPQRRPRAKKPPSALLPNQMQVSMDDARYEWCRAQEGGGPAYIRDLIASDMARKRRQKREQINAS